MLLIAIAIIVMAALGYASELPLPHFASDSNGNLHINTASSEQIVYVNGVNFNELVRDVAELKAAVGLTAPQPGRGRITDVINVQDGAAFLSAPAGVYLSANRTHNVTEGSNNWSPSSLTAVVGDYIRFQWSSMEAIYETQSDGTTMLQGGAVSGPASVSGEFVVRLTRPKTYYFRAANKGYLCTVQVEPFGISPSRNILELVMSQEFVIVGFGRRSSSSFCDSVIGALTSSCACSYGTFRVIPIGGSQGDIAFCVRFRIVAT